MKTILRTSCLFLLLAGLAMPPVASASGAYCVCITKPPTDRSKIDRDKYDLGQKIFNGRTKPNPVNPGSAEESLRQQSVLAEIQALLPKSKAKKTDLTTLAGKLTLPQLDALAYYVQLRYSPSK